MNKITLSKIGQVAAGAMAVLGLTVTHASAEVCLLVLCLGKTDDTSSTTANTTPAAPEIDVTQGLAALAILMVAGLILRERFLRRRERA